MYASLRVKQLNQTYTPLRQLLVLAVDQGSALKLIALDSPPFQSEVKNSNTR